MKVSLYLSAIIACLDLRFAHDAACQTFSNLYNFTLLTSNGAGISTNSDGAGPQGGLTLSGGNLYGTAFSGGNSGYGTIFKLTTNGTGFTNLHCFSPTLSSNHTNLDGANPIASLLLSGSNLYGTTTVGGVFGLGTVFRINTDGTGFTNLHNFVGGDGANPYGTLIISGQTLYGTTEYGNVGSVDGSVFRVNTDGTGFTNLHIFTGGSDEGYPVSGLLLFGETLFGAAQGGGLVNGTVFEINTNGTGFTNLHTFSSTSSSNFTNTDGAGPASTLILSGNTLFGTAAGGGSSDTGTVFAINATNATFTNLHNFSSISNYGPNSDGAYPYYGLILSGNALYGVADNGGISGNGTVFKVKTDGSGFTVLYNFGPTAGNNPWIINMDGANPLCSLVLSGDTLYGTTFEGGNSGSGTVFSILLGSSIQPQLSIIPYGSNVIVTWPTNATGFNLQSVASLNPGTSWISLSSKPIVIGGQNVIVDSIVGNQKFYRLIQQ